MQRRKNASSFYKKSHFLVFNIPEKKKTERESEREENREIKIERIEKERIRNIVKE